MKSLESSKETRIGMPTPVDDAPRPKQIILLRAPKVQERIQKSRTALYELLDAKSPRHDPNFPRPIKLSEQCRAVYWIEDEIDQWLADRVAAARGQQPPRTIALQLATQRASDGDAK